MWLILALALHLLVAGIASGHAVLQRKRPIVQCAWVFAIIGLPLVGLFLYLLLGTDRMRQRLLRQRLRYDALHDPKYAVQDDSLAKPEDFGPDDSIIACLTRLTSQPATRGNIVLPLLSPAEFYESLEEAIRTSTSRCWICFYIWRNDHVGQHFVDLLAAAAARGVDVRLICDEVGSSSARSAMFDRLVEAGGHFTWANTIAPRRNRWNASLRNHRKIALIDSVRSYMGGVNIGSEHTEGASGYRWCDLHFILDGPVTQQLSAVFSDDWHFAVDEILTAPPPMSHQMTDGGGTTIQIIAGGPDRERSIVGTSLRVLVQSARSDLIMCTPYLAPDDAFISELEMAVCRGVRVRLFVSRYSDMGGAPQLGRSFFQRLIKAGIEIYEYQAGIHHTKLVLIDHCLTLIGSINIDIRSFYLNYEIGALIADAKLTIQLEEEVLTRTTTHACVLEDILHRPVGDRLRESVLRLVAPLL